MDGPDSADPCGRLRLGGWGSSGVVVASACAGGPGVNRASRRAGMQQVNRVRVRGLRGSEGNRPPGASAALCSALPGVRSAGLRVSIIPTHALIRSHRLQFSTATGVTVVRKALPAVSYVIWS
jgi:hypothetical protein